MVNINIIIDDELHKKAKLKALMQDMSLKEFIIQSLEEKVKRDSKRGVNEKSQKTQQ